MKIKTKLFLVLACILHSCTKKEYEGPSIGTLYADFEIIEPLKLINTNPSFSNNPVPQQSQSSTVPSGQSPRTLQSSGQFSYQTY